MKHLPEPKPLLNLFFLLFSCLPVAAQLSVLKGKVVNSITRQPVEYAVVQSGQAHVITDKEGAFVITPGKKKQGRWEVTFSSVGYKSRSMQLDTDAVSIVLIELEPVVSVLPGVVVTNEANSILKKAFSRIPENYPGKPFKLNGVVRMRNEQDNGYLYSNDAYISVYTYPYHKRRTGEVKLIANKARLDTIPHFDMNTVPKWITAGRYIPGYDFVHNRSEYIDPANSKSFSWELKGKQLYHAHTAFVIEVRSREGLRGFIYKKLEGSLYIDTASYLFLAGNLIFYEVHPFLYLPMSRVVINVEYGNEPQPWHIQKLSGAAEYIRRDSITSKTRMEFFATSVDTLAVKPFGYDEVLLGTEAVQQLNVKVNSATWQQYEKLLQEAELKNGISKAVTPDMDTMRKEAMKYEGVKRNKLAGVARYLSTAYSVGFSLAKLPVSVGNPLTGAAAYAVGFNGQFRLYRNFCFRLGNCYNPGWGGGSGSFASYSLVQYFLILKRRFPLFLSPIAGYGRLTVKYTDGDHIKQKLQQNQWWGGMEMTTPVSRHIKLAADVTYHHGFDDNNAPAVMPVSWSYALGVWFHR